MAEIRNYLDSLRCACSDDLPWHLFEGKNILITGATGLIGSCLIDILMMRKHTYTVYAAGRNEERAKAKFCNYFTDDTFHFIHYDVNEPLHAEIPFHYMIHAASNASPNFFSSDPVGIIKANIDGVKNLVDYGIHHSLQRFLYVSSGEVYGEGCNEKWKEDDSGYVNCTTLRACYPASKRAAEALSIAYAHQYGIEVVIGRPCHTYGPGFTESDNRVYAQFLRNAINHQDIILKSTGKQYRSWIYVTDCAYALLYILLSGQNLQAYNIADEKSNITLLELAELISKGTGTKTHMELPSKQDDNATKITKATFDTTKLMKLGWKAQFNIQSGMQITINTLMEPSRD